MRWIILFKKRKHGTSRLAINTTQQIRNATDETHSKRSWLYSGFLSSLSEIPRTYTLLSHRKFGGDID